MAAGLRDDGYQIFIIRKSDNRYAAQRTGRREHGFNANIVTKNQWVHKAEKA